LLEQSVKTERAKEDADGVSLMMNLNEGEENKKKKKVDTI